MLDINWNLYKVFCIVAKSKSYTEASEKLNISISTISMHIKNLENQLNIQLFIRENDGVKLTEKGNELFNFFYKAMESITLGERVALEQNDISSGEISIACPSHLVVYFLMNRIEKANKDYPNLHIKLMSNPNQNEMIELLKTHKTDFIITDMLVDDSNIVIEELKEINNIFVSKEPIKINNLKELEKLKFIMNFEDKFSVKALKETLHKYDINIKSFMESDITEVRVEAVKRNLGIGYVIKDAVKKELEEKELYEVELPINLPTVKVNLIYVKGYLTKADKSFIKQYLKK